MNDSIIAMGILRKLKKKNVLMYKWFYHRNRMGISLEIDKFLSSNDTIVVSEPSDKL